MTKKNDIRNMLELGHTYNSISRSLNVTKSAINYHAKQLGIAGNVKRYNWSEIKEFYDSGKTRLECIEKYGMAKRSWDSAVARGDIKVRPRQIDLSAILLENSKYCRASLKERLLLCGLIRNECYECGQTPIWNENPLILVLDHINGINNDNRIENLRMLCPNCNSQQPTFAGRNTAKARRVLV